NVVQRMAVLCEGAFIDIDLVPDMVRAPAAAERIEAGLDGLIGGRGHLKSRVERLEELVISDALDRHHGNISRASAELGLSRVGLRGKMERYGLEKTANGRA
ncbi:MAG: hypothetical protein MI723_12855, partial [Caulobacterales bacterium]|nr:hypothetical protein [Caulobacterales bacterium]